MEHLLAVNGTGGAWLRVFGCDCGRCKSPVRQANTSASLITLDDTGRTIHHVLFDVGLGVVDSLVSNPYLAGANGRLDALVLTHWHPDHTAELLRLCASLHFSQKGDGHKPEPILTFCRRGTAEWMEKEAAFAWKLFIQPHTADENLPPGHLLPPLSVESPGLQITPVTLGHKRADRWASDEITLRYCCAGYVLETAASKAVLFWDAGSDNDWVLRPRNQAQQATVRRLSDADYLLIDCTEWHTSEPDVPHLTFEMVQEYVKALSPKETLLVHLSGHRDPPGQPAYGWSDEQWTAAAAAVWQEKGLPGHVRVPTIGEYLSL